MSTKHFEAIGRYQSGSATIDLYGDLTAQAAEALNAAYTALESQNPGVIFFNFAGVDYLNSTGIALLIGLLERARQSSHTLMAYGLCPFYAELFQLAGLHRYIPILSLEASEFELA
jgi:anti-anti-sigma factor